jgi:PAP2 superfamily
MKRTVDALTEGTTMQPTNQTRTVRQTTAAAIFAALATSAYADVITDWSSKASDLVVEAKLGTPPAVRALALVQTAVQEAVDTTTRRDSSPRQPTEAAHGASVDAAVAAANRATLAKLLPSQQASIDAAYQSALAQIADGPTKAAGIAAGESAAAAVLALRADDRPASAEAYRPHAAPGAYVPTATPAVPHWAQRKPWLMTSSAQFRPGPPPTLTSSVWARDYNEVKAVGSKTSIQRSAEQAEIARFWEYSLPPIYLGVVRSVAQLPGRDVTQNARLFAAVLQAMDDAMIAVFDAKYHYNFWRPATAIRNGDIDGNEATERDATWTPFIDAPLHPEYPSAHSILAGAVGAVLKAEISNGPVPVLTTSSPTAKGAVRRWSSLDDFTREVGDARIYEGIHYRTSTDVGAAMGQRIGGLAAEKLLQLPHSSVGGLACAGAEPTTLLPCSVAVR